MISLAEDLFPIYRTIAGPGTLETLEEIKKFALPELQIKGFASGQRVFDWVVPNEYEILDAVLYGPNSEIICDFKINNLSVVAHSTAVDLELDLLELQGHLHSLPEQPDAIPYVTSYYNETWGFCLTQNERNKLQPGKYRAKINSRTYKGQMSYGEVVAPGLLEDEILISTYICHPGMANNEISGPVVATYLARKLLDMPNRKYTYRFIFVPETIGSIAYIESNLEYLKKHVIAGYVLTCIGDNRAHSYLPSRFGNTQADIVAQTILSKEYPKLKIYPWSERGSDERQFCSPGVDLPVGSIMRSKYWEYPEYHTSLDQLGTVVTEEGLRGGLEMVSKVLQGFEQNYFPIATFPCEPNLGSRSLYPTVSKKGIYKNTKLLLHVLTWSDGRHSLLDITRDSDFTFKEVFETAELLRENGLIKDLNQQMYD